MNFVRSASQLSMLSLIMLGSCADVDAPMEDKPPEQALEQGDKTFDLPAVGRVFAGSSCTATLINSRVILTAAHCFNFDKTHGGFGDDDGTKPSFSSAPSGWTFRIETSSGAKRDFPVHRFAVYDTNYGKEDIAVAELGSDVPESVATPLDFSGSWPDDGDPVTVWGYGASTGEYTEKGWINVTFPDGTVKRHIEDTWNAAEQTGSTSVGCPGDSGGPLLNSSLEVVAVLSAGDCTGGDGLDTRADVAVAGKWVSQVAAIYGRAKVCKWCDHISARTENGQYLQAVYGGGGGVTAEPSEVGDWETWRIVPLGGAYVALQTQSGQFLSAQDGGGGGVTADRELLGAWETFYTEDSSQMILRTFEDPYYYVSAENGGGGAVTADKTEPGTWESFTVDSRPAGN